MVASDTLLHYVSCMKQFLTIFYTQTHTQNRSNAMRHAASQSTIKRNHVISEKKTRVMRFQAELEVLVVLVK